MAADPYAVLGVSKGVSDPDLRRAYLKLARKHHPDSQPEAKRDAAERKMQEINAAWALVSDPKRRAAFDRNGSARSGGAGGAGSARSANFKADYSRERDWVHDPNDPYWTKGEGAWISSPGPATRAGTGGAANLATMIPPALFVGGVLLMAFGLLISLGPLAVLGAFGIFFSVVAYLMLAFYSMASSRARDRR